MWEELDSALLESDGPNYNNLKKVLKYKKQKYVDTCQQIHLPHVIKIVMAKTLYCTMR